MLTLERVDVNANRDGRVIVSLRSSELVSWSMFLAREPLRAVEQIDDAIAKLHEVRARLAADQDANSNFVSGV